MPSTRNEKTAPAARTPAPQQRSAASPDRVDVSDPAAEAAGGHDLERRLDEACVERALAGDRGAFEEIYVRHREAVFKVAFGVVRNAEDALDVVQETFLKAWRCLERFERRSSLLTWLCQIAIHRAIDMTRRKKVRKAAELEEFMMGDRGQRAGAGGLATSDPIGPRPSLEPGVLAQGDELKAALDGALGKLSEKHREVFVLYTVKGLSYREISTSLGIQIGTVMSRLFYARKHLQEMLHGFGGAA